MPDTRHETTREPERMIDLTQDELVDRVYKALPRTPANGIRESVLAQRLALSSRYWRVSKALRQLRRERRAIGDGGWWRALDA